MRFLYILTLAFCFPVALLAQKNVPGYMGKKWNLQYQLYLFPSFTNPNSEDVEVISPDAIDVKTSLNLQSHITVAYALSKRMEALAEFNMASTNFDPYSSYVADFNLEELKYPGMKARGGAIGIRLYTKHFAPLGSYITFKMGYTKLTIDDLYYSVADYNSGGGFFEHSISGGTKGAPTLTAGFGTNRVIADRFVISYGLDFTFFAGGFGNWKPIFAEESGGAYIDFYNGNTASNQDAYLKKAAARYAMQCMVNLKIGVGILL